MCVCTLCACLVVPESRKGHALPATRVRNGVGPSCGCWEPNLRMNSRSIFTTEPSPAVLKGRLSNPVQLGRRRGLTWERRMHHTGSVRSIGSVGFNMAAQVAEGDDCKVFLASTHRPAGVQTQGGWRESR